MNQLPFFLKNLSALIILTILIALRSMPHPAKFTLIISSTFIRGIFFKNTLLSTVFFSIIALFSKNYLIQKLEFKRN